MPYEYAKISNATCSITAYNYYDYESCTWKLGIKKILGETESITRYLSGGEGGYDSGAKVVGEAAIGGGCTIVDIKNG